jgi:hypothetical protein
MNYDAWKTRSDFDEHPPENSLDAWHERMTAAEEPEHDGPTCPKCGESNIDRLIWTNDETVVCHTCGDTMDMTPEPERCTGCGMVLDLGFIMAGRCGACAAKDAEAKRDDKVSTRIRMEMAANDIAECVHMLRTSRMQPVIVVARLLVKIENSLRGGAS